MPILWNDALNTGLRNIDLQHRELVDTINALEALLALPHALDEARFVLDSLCQYVSLHFGYEELLMEQGDFPQDFRRAHIQQHRGFAAEIDARIARLHELHDKHALLQLPELHEFLKTWLLQHIGRTDQELARIIVAAPCD